MMQEDFSIAVESFVGKSPAAWMNHLCEALRSFPATASTDFVLQRLPATNNADLSFLATNVVKRAAGVMSWEALSRVLEATHAAYSRWKTEQHIELLWSGPSPSNRIPARRIDQALYDLIGTAQQEILLVTFAAGKIERLASELMKAIHRGVRVRLILEFEQSSEGQLSYDALKAFPSALILSAKVYHWPTERRERNHAGKPGKLHAKVAIVDDVAVISSANLTDDAFSRNFEMGLRVQDREFLDSVRGYIDALIADGTLELVSR